MPLGTTFFEAVRDAPAYSLAVTPRKELQKVQSVCIAHSPHSAAPSTMQVYQPVCERYAQLEDSIV